ncbi:MAG: DNA-binding protein [Candidatus Neomarinimicrobiota bacterium]
MLKSYDWAIEQRNKGVCVVSGFHSQIEKDVLHFLLKGTQPVIMVLARGMKKNLSPDVRKALDEKRLLIVSPFAESVGRVSEKTSIIRNEVITNLADEIQVAFVRTGGNLEYLISRLEKPVRIGFVS